MEAEAVRVHFLALASFASFAALAVILAHRWLRRQRTEEGRMTVEKTSGKGTMGLWRRNGIPGGKYLVQRRDGTVPEWPHLVLGARDEAAEAAIRAYAAAAEGLGYDPAFVSDVRALADEFRDYRTEHGTGDPDGKPHRPDDPATVAKMTRGKSA